MTAIAMSGAAGAVGAAQVNVNVLRTLLALLNALMLKLTLPCMNFMSMALSLAITMHLRG